MDYQYEVKFYFGKIYNNNNVVRSQFIPACMAQPRILEALVYSHKAIFCTCTKYGCKQFNPWPHGVRPDCYSERYVQNFVND